MPGRCAADIEGELDEQEAGMVVQHIVLEAEHAQSGAGATNGRVDFADLPTNSEPTRRTALALAGEYLYPLPSLALSYASGLKKPTPSAGKRARSAFGPGAAEVRVGSSVGRAAAF